jgi:hypothetical protein
MNGISSGHPAGQAIESRALEDQWFSFNGNSISLSRSIAGAEFVLRNDLANHSHIVTSGCGRVQHEGGPVEEIHPSDVAWFSTSERHWHSATPTTAMTHIAVQESHEWQSGGLDGTRH